MAENNTQNMSNEDQTTNFTLAHSPSFPILEIEIVSPSLSLCIIPQSHSDGSIDLSSLLEGAVSPTTRLTVELLGDRTQAATFDMNLWGWSTTSPMETIQVNHITPRQRTFSVCTVQSRPTSIAVLLPISMSVPVSLPSLYVSSNAGDDEDDGTEAESVFTNEVADNEPQIHTTNSIPSISATAIITAEIEVDALEAFVDFENLGSIVAAFHIPADDSDFPSDEMFEYFGV